MAASFVISSVCGCAGDVSSVTESASSTSPYYPAGIYATASADTPLDPGIVQNKGVVGILLYARWGALEPSKGAYDFESLALRIGEAKKAKLVVALSIVDSPMQAPDWLSADSSVETITLLEANRYNSSFCETASSPLFWDATSHAARKSLIAAAGTRFATDATVVAVMSSFANYTTDDWLIPHRVGTTCGQKVR